MEIRHRALPVKILSLPDFTPGHGAAEFKI